MSITNVYKESIKFISFKYHNPERYLLLLIDFYSLCWTIQLLKHSFTFLVSYKRIFTAYHAIFKIGKA